MVAGAQEKLDKASEKFYSGNALYNKRLYSLAIKEYLAYLQEFPTHSKVEHARLGVALCLYAQKKWPEAEKELTNVIQRRKAGDPDKLGLMLAQCMINLKRPADARKAFEPVTRSKNAEFKTTAMAAITESWFKEQNWEEVAKASARLLASSPADKLKLRGLYEGSYAQFQLGAYAKAIPLLIELAPLAKGGAYESQCAFILAECYRETGDLAKATAAYEAAGTGLTGEMAAEVAYRLGLVNFQKANYDDAVKGLEKSIKLSPDGEFSDPSRLLLGRAYLEMQDYRKAEQHLRSLSQRSEEQGKKRKKKLKEGLIFSDARAAFWYARVFSRQKKYDQAENVLAEAVKRFDRDPLSMDLQYDYVNALMVNEKYKEASGVLGRMLQKKDYPQRSDLLRFYAECLHRNKDYANSLKYADEYLAAYGKEKHVGDIKFLKAENLNLLAKIDEALPVYVEIFSKYKDNKNVETARFRAAQIHRRKGDSEKVSGLMAELQMKAPEGAVFSQAKFVAGDAAFRQRKWAEAIVHLNAFVDQHMKDRRRASAEPNLDAAFVQMAVSSLNLQKIDDAAGYFEQVIKLFSESPHRPLALAELGRIQYEKGDHSKAKSTLSHYVQSKLKKTTLNAQVDYYLGWIAMREKRLPEAEKHFYTVVHKHRTHELAPDAAIQLGRAYLEQEKFNEAAQTYINVLIKEWPDHKQMDLAVFSLGVSYARRKDWRNAAIHFAAVDEKHPKSEVADRALYELAWCAKGLKKNDEAVLHYKKLIEKHPGSSLVEKVRTEMAELTFAKADYDAVIAELKDTLEKLTDPKLKEETTYRLGTAYFNKADFENAAGTFEAFIAQYEKSPKLASVYFHAGEARMKLKETIKARDHFLEAHKRNQQEEMRESIQLRLAETQRLTRQYQDAATTYTDFIRRFPESKWLAQAHFDHGWCVEKQKNYSRAAAEYRKVIAMDKRDEVAARAQFQIGECLFAMKKYDDAIQELIKVTVAYSHKKWQARAALEIGRALEALGEEDKALEQFREVMKKYPKEQTIVDSARKHVSMLRHGK